MPLSQPATPRKPSHLRQTTFRSFARDDGLWDIEGELHDSKFEDMVSPIDGSVRPAGAPVHHMHLRVTIDAQLTVHAIESAMDSTPLQECPRAQTALQTMVGCNMGRGWRKAIDHNLGSVASCTHLRELLFNMATAGFQTLTSAFANEDPNAPPRFLNQCTGWDLRGEGARLLFPQFAIHPIASDAP